MSQHHQCEEKEETLIYKIGLFSEMNKVTIKALRHYDEIGLLKPEFIDKANGYRYYTSTQLPRLNEIISLKQMGISLEEIREILDGKKLDEVLKHKKVQLLKEISQKTMELSKVEYYLSHKNQDENYHIVIKELPRVIVASMRTIIKNYDDLFSVVPPMGSEMERLGCKCAVPEYCFNIYHDGEYKEENINIEVCEAVTEMKEDSDKVKFKVIPQIKTAACTFHKGPYSELRYAYSALIKWIENNGYETIDNARESYIDGVWNKDNEEEWLTEIQIPVRKRQS